MDEVRRVGLELLVGLPSDNRDRLEAWVCGSMEAALAVAKDVAFTVQGRLVPIQLFKQGERVMGASAWTFRVLDSVLALDPTPKFGDVTEHFNRVLNPQHAGTINDYLHENRRRYILPPLVLNVKHGCKLYMATQISNGLSFGFAVLSGTSRFVPVDGQHKAAAVLGYRRYRKPREGDVALPFVKVPGALEQDESFGDDAIPIHLTFEDDVVQVRQDFSDCSHTKPIAASTKAAMDSRDVINDVTRQVIELSDLLQDNTETAAASISARSNKLFLRSSVASFVRLFLSGSFRGTEDLIRQLGTPQGKGQAIARVSRALGLLATVTPWQDIAVATPGGISADTMQEWRETYINMSGAALEIIGAAIHIALETPGTSLEAVCGSLSGLDWRRDNPVWEDIDLVTTDDEDTVKIVTAQAEKLAAAAGLARIIGG